MERIVIPILSGLGAGLLFYVLITAIVKDDREEWRCLKYSPVNGECILQERKEQ